MSKLAFKCQVSGRSLWISSTSLTLASDGENEACTKGHDIHAVQQRKDRGVKNTTGPAHPPITGNYRIRYFRFFLFWLKSILVRAPSLYEWSIDQAWQGALDDPAPTGAHRWSRGRMFWSCCNHTMIDTSDRSRNTEIEEKKRQACQGIGEQEHASRTGLIDWVIQRFPHRFGKFYG